MDMEILSSDKKSVISEEDEDEILYKLNSNSKNDNNKYDKHKSKRKPISRKAYNNLLKQMIHITEKNVNLIEQEPNRSNNIYNDIIEEYISTLQTTLIQMKNGYIYALVKKHYYSDKNMKKRILLQENIPQKRNNVKKAFNAAINENISKKELQISAYIF